MRYHLFLHYGWFVQNLGKEFIQTNYHTTVCNWAGGIRGQGGNYTTYIFWQNENLFQQNTFYYALTHSLSSHTSQPSTVSVYHYLWSKDSFKSGFLTTE